MIKDRNPADSCVKARYVLSLRQLTRSQYTGIDEGQIPPQWSLGFKLAGSGGVNHWMSQYDDSPL